MRRQSAGKLALETASENDSLPPEVSEIDPFSDAVNTVDVDADFMEGVARHITAILMAARVYFLETNHKALKAIEDNLKCDKEISTAIFLL